MVCVLIALGAGIGGPVTRGPVSMGNEVRPYYGKKGDSLMLSDHLIPILDTAPRPRVFYGDKYTPFYPMANGDGWIPPVSVATDPNRDEWTPMIAVDAAGVLWCTVNVIQQEYYDAVGIYYSTDKGSTWNFRTFIAGYVDLGDPVIAIDVGRSPNRMYIGFWGYYGYNDYDAGWFTLDISGTTLTTVSSGWFETSTPNVSGPSIAMVERGYNPNYVFMAWEYWYSQSNQYVIRVARSSDGVSWTQNDVYQPAPGRYCGQVWGNAGNNTNPAILINYKYNPSGTDWATATVAGLLISTNRGGSWSNQQYTPGGNIFQTSSAIGYGTNNMVWAIQTNPNSNDGNILIRYSTDRGSTWTATYYIENSPLTIDSRMPIVYADGMQQTNYTSQLFYLGFYRETVSGSGRGNYYFKVAPVSSATTASSWVCPKGVDSFAIANEASYSVQEANWAQLHLVPFIFNGGYAPGLVWNHQTSASNHDIFFTRPIAPLYEEVNEDGSAEPGFYVHQISNPATNKLLLEIGLPSDSRVNLVLYGSDGRTVLSDGFEFEAGRHQIQKDISRLPAGVYFLKVSAQMGEVSGKIMVK